MPPHDDEYHFRTLAKGLIDKWHALLNANKPVEGVRLPVGVPVSVAAGADADVNPAMAAAPLGRNLALRKDKMKNVANQAEVTRPAKGLDLNGKGAFVAFCGLACLLFLYNFRGGAKCSCAYL